MAVESNQIDSTHEMEYLKSVYKKLTTKKNLPKDINDILSKLKEVMLKHGKADGDKDLLNAETLNNNQYCKEDYE